MRLKQDDAFESSSIPDHLPRARQSGGVEPPDEVILSLATEPVSAENPRSFANDDELVCLDPCDLSVAPLGHLIVRSANVEFQVSGGARNACETRRSRAACCERGEPCRE